MENKFQVIALGNDHTNTLGVVQNLGRAGHPCHAYMWGVRKNVVKSSRNIASYKYFNNVNDAINGIEDDFKKCREKVIIIACCDDAAQTLDIKKDELNKWGFLFQQSYSEKNVSQLQNKYMQTEIAAKCGFNVPLSFVIDSVDNLPKNLPYPIITKPLASILGSKGDIKVCNTKIELIEALKCQLQHCEKILVQQYINKDYDYTIMGVGLRSHKAIAPTIFKKTLIAPPKTGLEVKGVLYDIKDVNLGSCSVDKFIEATQFVGLFSIELMHSIDDDKFYFIEANLRNDGCTPMAAKAGVNLPYLHCVDMMGQDIPIDIPLRTPLKGIWDNHHLSTLFHGYISLFTWMKDIMTKDVFLFFDWHDPKPAIRLVLNMLKNKF